MLRRFLEQVDRLNCRRARADDANALAAEVDVVVRPLACVIQLALERIDPGNARDLRHRQAAGGHHTELRSRMIAAIRLNEAESGSPGHG